MRSEFAVLRFGLGARPGELTAAASDPRGWLLSQIQGAVPRVGSAPLSSAQEILSAQMAARDARRQARRSDAVATGNSGNPVQQLALLHYREQVLARGISAATTATPFAERLVHFWTNHFAVSADKGTVTGVAGTLENEAIRPHVCGRFVDLLMAVEQHPAMILFLDNQHSAGADSPLALVAAKRHLGINENLGREILELHTLGVNGGYTQADVTSLARILTGWSVGGGSGRLAGGTPGAFLFREHLHEPGPAVFMGKRYAQVGLSQGEAVLADVARHPATAHFLAGKLARHFIADEPPAAAVEHIAHRYLTSDGDLRAVYQALLEAADAADPKLPQKAKTPTDFVFSTWRALDWTPRQPQDAVRSFNSLGQRQYAPGSAAGWPDTAASWDGADALLQRIAWATLAAGRDERGLQPTDVAQSCLGQWLRSETKTALRRAASATQALILLLMSPEFQRR